MGIMKVSARLYVMRALFTFITLQTIRTHFSEKIYLLVEVGMSFLEVLSQAMPLFTCGDEITCWAMILFVTKHFGLTNPTLVF